jgi:hypothetical protein
VHESVTRFYFRDIEVHARFLVALPTLIAEPKLDGRTTRKVLDAIEQPPQLKLVATRAPNIQQAMPLSEDRTRSGRPQPTFIVTKMASQARSTTKA